MTIVFRVDASIQMGTGHVMRCLTLADALKQQGSECYFICRKHSGNLIASIESRGHTVYSLSVYKEDEVNSKDNTPHVLAHASWLGATQEVDALLSMEIVELLKPDWLIVDHYGIDSSWEQKLRKYCRHLMVIDDLADRQHDCDLLLDQTFGRDLKDYMGLVPSKCQLLCGAQFALLRPEFAEWRDYSLNRRRDGQIEYLLINLGGVDKDNITTLILKSLITSPLPSSCRITVIMGSTAPWVSSVKKQAKIMPWNTSVKVGVDNMAELLANSDYAIGAAGATSWERCCLGLPTLMVTLADNQKLIASKLKSVGAAIITDVNIIGTSVLINKNGISTNALKRMSVNARRVTDGKGVFKILTHLKRQV